MTLIVDLDTRCLLTEYCTRSTTITESGPRESLSVTATATKRLTIATVTGATYVDKVGIDVISVG